MSDAGCDRQAFNQRIVSIAGQDNVWFDEPMSEHTTFQIGGPAALYVAPDTPERVRVLVQTCKEFGVPYFILGRGSDLLVADKGWAGCIICLADALDDVLVEDTRLIAQAGTTLRDASEMACALGLSGLEFACGIPGTVGGAVFMNAGAYGGQISDIISSADVLTPEGDIITLTADELDLGYRHSRVADESLVVLSATFELVPDTEEAIRARMDDFTQRREEKQPLELPSAGSTFKRPEGYFAGKLIMDAGLQGYRSGGAEVSTKHAGFVVNIDHATAADVRAVISHVQETIYAKEGVKLEPEVRFLGF